MISKGGIDYSKWDQLTLSDEEEGHQGVITQKFVLNRNRDGYIKSGDENAGVGGAEGESVWKADVSAGTNHVSSQSTQAPPEPTTEFQKIIAAASKKPSPRPTRQSKKSVNAPEVNAKVAPPPPASQAPESPHRLKETWGSSVPDDSSSAESEGDRWLDPLPLADGDLPASVTLMLRSDLWKGLQRPIFVKRGQRLK